MSSEVDLKQFVDGGDGISTVRTSQVFDGESFRGWNGIKYKAGLSAKNTSASKLSMNVATVAPGAIAYAHIHDGFELMLYVMQEKSVIFMARISKSVSKTRPAILSLSSLEFPTKSIT